MSRIENIRKMTGLNRTKFAELYGIPLRTVEDWESGKSNPPAYVEMMLNRIVREDNNRPATYYVYSIDTATGEEWELCKTNNYFKAEKVAEADRKDGSKYRSEIRRYRSDIEDEDCTCFDYDIMTTWLDCLS